MLSSKQKQKIALIRKCEGMGREINILYDLLNHLRGIQEQVEEEIVGYTGVSKMIHRKDIENLEKQIRSLEAQISFEETSLQSLIEAYNHLDCERRLQYSR